MKVFNDEAALALATLSVDQLVRTKGSGSATDGQTILWRIAASGVGITLANGNVAIALVNDKSGRKNLIINGNMDIWQRGTNFPAAGFTADRWNQSGAGITTSRIDVNDLNGFGYAAHFVGGGIDFRQPIELKRVGFNGVFTVGKTFTLTFWGKSTAAVDVSVFISWLDSSNNATNRVIEVNVTSVGTSSTSWQRFEYTFTIAQTPNPTNTLLEFNLRFATGGDHSITGVQVEEGTVATEFEYRPIAEELALCMRYFQIIKLNGFTSNVVARNNGGGTLIGALLPLPVVMRVNPTTGNTYSRTVKTTGLSVTYTQAAAAQTISLSSNETHYAFNCTTDSNSSSEMYAFTNNSGGAGDPFTVDAEL